MKVFFREYTVPEAVLPQFQMLMELARSRKQSADVGKILTCNRESNGQNKDFVRLVQGATEVCGTRSVDDINPQELRNHETDGSIGAEGCKTGTIAEEPLFCGESVEEQVLEAEGRIAQETVSMEGDEPSGSQEVGAARG